MIQSQLSNDRIDLISYLIIHFLNEKITTNPIELNEISPKVILEYPGIEPKPLNGFSSDVSVSVPVSVGEVVESSLTITLVSNILEIIRPSLFIA